MSARDSVGPVFAALADPTRRHVIRLLVRAGDVTATQLAGDLPMSRQAVCKHLAVLEDAGLVGAIRRGREVRYSLAPENLDTAMRWMADVGSRWDERLRSLQRHMSAGVSPRPSSVSKVTKSDTSRRRSRTGMRTG